MSVNAARLLLRLLDKFSLDTNVYISAWGPSKFALHGLSESVVAATTGKLRRSVSLHNGKSLLVFTSKVLASIRQSGLVKRVLLPRPHDGIAFVHVTSLLPACPEPGGLFSQEQVTGGEWLKLSAHIHELLSRNDRSVAWLALVMEEYCARAGLVLTRRAK